MTPTEVSLFSSLSSVGALIGTPLFGYLLDKIGRKYSAVTAGFSYVIAWIMVVFTKSVEIILAAVFISGFGGSVVLIAPLYIAEICENSIRGALTSGIVIFYGLGVLLAYILGGYTTYYGNVYTQLILSIVYVLLVFGLKESPLYLMKIGKEQEAATSIAFYRSLKPSSKIVLEEIEHIKCALNPIDNIPEEESQLKGSNFSIREVKQVSTLKFIAESKSTKRALTLTLLMMTACLLMGLGAIQVYAEPLFQRLSPDWSANLCSISLAILVFIANLIAAYLTDIAGRRALMIYSAMASGVSMLLLASQLQYSWAPPWVNAVLVLLFSVAFSLGSGTIPYVLVAEVFLPEVKSFCSMLIIEWGWLINFVLLFAFSPLEELIGLSNVFYIFSIICFSAMIYSMFKLPETKGLPLDVIQTLFDNNRRTLY